MNHTVNFRVSLDYFMGTQKARGLADNSGQWDFFFFKLSWLDGSLIYMYIMGTNRMDN